jgi:hypothetical protein
MNVATGIGMLCIAVAMVLLGRPRNGEDARLFMRSPLIYAAFPVIILVFIAMGTQTIVMNLRVAANTKVPCAPGGQSLQI